jgi:hypothetical protein
MLANMCLCGFTGSMRYNFVARDRITSLKISNAIFDDLYVSKIPAKSKINYFKNFNFTNPIPTIWDYDTVLKSTYNNTADASNVEFSVNNTDALIIKKRLKGTFSWTVVDTITTQNPEDFDFIIRDLYSASNKTYEYTLVPYINGNEGRYISVMVDSKFDGLHVLDKDNIYSAFGNVEFNTTKNRPNSVITPFYSKYAYVVANGSNDYYTGSASGIFAEFIDCKLQFDDYRNYHDKLLDFLNNGETKVLKIGDGRMYMININDTPSESQGELPKLSKISFNWSEVGNMYSNEDLCNSGLSNVSGDWTNLIEDGKGTANSGTAENTNTWLDIDGNTQTVSTFSWKTI